MMGETLEETCKRLEHWETDAWAARAVLRKEILTPDVIDPGCGAGVLLTALSEAGYRAFGQDIHDWGVGDIQRIWDWLADGSLPLHYRNKNGEFTVFMNPPFTLSEAFVEKAFEYGARKIVCFQKFSWWEGSFSRGKKRGQFWQKYPPCRIYVCGDRADCWRHDIPHAARINGTPTAYAWFVWERGQPAGTLIGHIYKEDVQ